MTVSGLWKKIIKPLSIIDITNILFLALILIFYIATFGRTPYRIPLLIIYTVLFVYLFSAPRLRNDKAISNGRRLLFFLYPVLFLIIIFETFYMILPYFNTLRFDALLDKADMFLLGVSPTLWAEQWAHPLLTDTLYFFYIFYFPMPFIILGWLYKKKKFMAMEKAFFIYLICYYSAYIIYFFIPAEGPRFFLQHLYTDNLNGYFLAGPVRTLVNTLEPNKLDAFPSLHAGILGVTMAVSYLNNKKIFYWFLPAAVGITVSLIYCRYHYFTDMLAGFLLAAFSVYAGQAIYVKIQRKFAAHFGSSQE